MTLNKGIIIQARTGSSRLKGKVLYPLLGKTVLETVILNAKKISGNIPIIVATTDLIADNEIGNICNKISVPCFRGDEQNVCKRFIDVCKIYNFDYCIRICADSPFFDHIEAEKLLNELIIQKGDAGLNSFDLNIPYGMGSQAFNAHSLIKAYNNGISEEEKEHVTLHFYKNPQKYNIIKTISRPFLQNRNIRIVLDYPEDYEVFNKISKQYNNTIPDSESLIEYLESSGTCKLNSMHPYTY
jgi:spore coat polysaccharide biosynthesis protein SpsF